MTAQIAVRLSSLDWISSA